MNQYRFMQWKIDLNQKIYFKKKKSPTPPESLADLNFSNILHVLHVHGILLLSNEKHVSISKSIICAVWRKTHFPRNYFTK